jgi:hypothetical protein
VVHVSCNNRASSRRALEALRQIMTTPQVRDGQARASDWMAYHNDLQVAARTPAVEERDNYAIAKQQCSLVWLFALRMNPTR